MKKLLFVGDSPECPSGFGRATREILDRVRDRYDVTVLGINHRGDPGTVPYPVYVAAAGGDAFGIGRLLWMCDVVKPDVVVIQQDGWYFPYYVNALRKRKPNYEYESPVAASLPIVAAVAVDGKNFSGEWIENVTLAIFWTKFAESEARQGGYIGPSKVIPLGVDTDMFYPVPREGALERQRMGTLKNAFIVGNVNRNQPRKRWDLTIKYFAEWVHSFKVKDARLFLHSAPTGDCSVNIESLCRYYGVLNQVVIYTPEPFYGKDDAGRGDGPDGDGGDGLRRAVYPAGLVRVRRLGEGRGRADPVHLDRAAVLLTLGERDRRRGGREAVRRRARPDVSREGPPAERRTVWAGTRLRVAVPVEDDRGSVDRGARLALRREARRVDGDLARPEGDGGAGLMEGAPQMVANIKLVAREFPKRTASALYLEAQIEVTEMKKRTPVDTTPNAPHPGNLRNSLHAEHPEISDRMISVTIASGMQAMYAIFVHENPDAYHPIGEWKFMESVLNESRSTMAARLASRLDLNKVTL